MEACPDLNFYGAVRMKIQEQDRYHGPALVQIVEHKSFKAVNRVSEKYGHYLINTDTELFVKYRTNDSTPWTFTWQPDEVRILRKAVKSKKHVFICLVCGSTTICALNEDEFTSVLDLVHKDVQWIKVDAPPNKSCQVSGWNGELARKVPHNSFPNKLFEK